MTQQEIRELVVKKVIEFREKAELGIEIIEAEKSEYFSLLQKVKSN